MPWFTYDAGKLFIVCPKFKCHRVSCISSGHPRGKGFSSLNSNRCLFLVWLILNSLIEKQTNKQKTQCLHTNTLAITKPGGDAERCRPRRIPAEATAEVSVV